VKPGEVEKRRWDDEGRRTSGVHALKVSGRTVSMRRIRRILPLVVLLAWPCLGLGGSARAGFALVLAVDGAELEKSSESSSSGGADPSKNGRDPAFAELFRRLTPAWQGLQSSSSSSGTSSPSPTSGSGGSGLVGTLTQDCPLTGFEESERLFLADERFKPPPFASRLFRPPR
jgi:hypothetical protein